MRTRTRDIELVRLRTAHHNHHPCACTQSIPSPTNDIAAGGVNVINLIKAQCGYQLPRSRLYGSHMHVFIRHEFPHARLPSMSHTTASVALFRAHRAQRTLALAPIACCSIIVFQFVMPCADSPHNTHTHTHKCVHTMSGINYNRFRLSSRTCNIIYYMCERVCTRLSVNM